MIALDYQTKHNFENGSNWANQVKEQWVIDHAKL
jgi:hypothetical protein